MGERTRVYLARKESESVKTSVPEGARKTLKLSDKDELDWKDTTSDGKPAYLVTKVEKSD